MHNKYTTKIERLPRSQRKRYASVACKVFSQALAWLERSVELEDFLLDLAGHFFEVLIG